MSDEWWISPVDGHRHATRLVQGGADGPDVDDCAVCALEAERDRLRAVVAEADVLMRLCQNCHDDWRRYQAGHDMGEIVAGLPLPTSVENDRLRAVVEAARNVLVWAKMNDHRDGSLAALFTVLAALDRSGDMGGPSAVDGTNDPQTYGDLAGEVEPWDGEPCPRCGAVGPCRHVPGVAPEDDAPQFRDPFDPGPR